MKNIVLVTLLFCSFATAHSQSTAEGSSSAIEKKTFVYKTVGKTPIHADLYRPANDDRIKPVIVWIHGGGLIGGSRGGLREEQKQVYLTAGYSVVSIDYRLAPETKIPAIVDDVKDALEWVRKNGRSLLKIDPARIFVVGHSAGGYLALMAGTFKNPPKGIISFYGYGDIRADWYSKPDSFYLATRALVSEERAMGLISDSVVTASVSNERGDIYLYSRQRGKWPLLVGGRDPQKDEQWFYQFCPLKNVHAKYPPTLLIHGDKDSDVPFEQSVQMDQELESKKIKHKFIRLENYEHGFDRSPGLADPATKNVFSEVVSFLDSCQ